MDNGASSYRRFLDGDDNAFVEIVRDYKDGLILYLTGYVKSVSVAEELVEDTFVKLGIKKPHFSEKSSFKTWLYSIARNLAIDYLRKKSNKTVVSIDEVAEIADMQSLENVYFKKQQQIAVHKAMENLKEEYRRALWLFYFEDFSNKQIAKIMKKSTHNIESLMYRARNALKSELVKEGIEYEKL